MLVVVGGHSRNVGKTSVVAGLIQAIPQARWTAVKLTQHGHGVCADQGEQCACAGDPAHPFAIDEETAPNATDSGRFLAAGAQRAYWVRTRVGDLGHAVPSLRAIIAEGQNTIVESNSLLDFFVPDLYIAVLDFSVADMKDSARRFLSRADALVVCGPPDPPDGWMGVPRRWIEGRPRFVGSPPRHVSDELAAFVATRLGLDSD
jgi:hypothetical protein